MELCCGMNSKMAALPRPAPICRLSQVAQAGMTHTSQPWQSLLVAGCWAAQHLALSHCGTTPGESYACLPQALST